MTRVFSNGEKEGTKGKVGARLSRDGKEYGMNERIEK